MEDCILTQTAPPGHTVNRSGPGGASTMSLCGRRLTGQQSPIPCTCLQSVGGTGVENALRNPPRRPMLPARQVRVVGKQQDWDPCV